MAWNVLTSSTRRTTGSARSSSASVGVGSGRSISRYTRLPAGRLSRSRLGLPMKPSSDIENMKRRLDTAYLAIYYNLDRHAGRGQCRHSSRATMFRCVDSQIGPAEVKLAVSHGCEHHPAYSER